MVFENARKELMTLRKRGKLSKKTKIFQIAKIKVEKYLKKCLDFLNTMPYTSRVFNHSGKKGGMDMPYKELKKLYYGDQETYKSTYDQRFSSEGILPFCRPQGDIFYIDAQQRLI